MQVFVAIAERGSLSAAADALEISAAMVSRHLAALEEWLGVRLVHRTTRRIALTGPGEEALVSCRQLLALSHEMQHAAAQVDGPVRGLVRVTASNSFAERHLMPSITSFVQQHPKVQVDVMATDRTLELVDERIDLAIRITEQPPLGAVARRLSTCRSVVCAAPSYLARRGVPRTPRDLGAHDCIAYSYFGRSTWRFARGKRIETVSVTGPLTSNDAALVLAATLEGGGIALQPTYLANSKIAAGQLVHLLPKFEPTPLGIFAVYSSRLHLPAATQRLIEHLTEHFRGTPPWDEDDSEQRSTKER